MKRTKIVATIGPASEKKSVLEKMVRFGMDVARLNFSHGDFDWHNKAIVHLRTISEKTKKPIAIMADMQGPKIRIANNKEVKLEKGEIVCIANDSAKSNYKKIFLDLKEAVKLIKKGNDVLIEDGLISLKVFKKSRNQVLARVVDSGVVKPRKGVNIPGISAKLGALTKSDLEVLDFAIKKRLDFIAMSFVRSANEVKKLKKLILKKSKGLKQMAQIVVKIERREAIKNFDKILQATDVVMVARGDLGVEMPQEELPILQKEIIDKCLRAGKPVIVATQMLNSMIRNPRPTRAEVSDVANAVIEHADAVMLSGETANGNYPVETVNTMRRIILKTEASPFDDLEHGFLGDQKSSISAAVANTAHELLKDSKAKAIIVASISGFTARMIARHRPEQPIYVMTNNETTQRQLMLVWGVRSFVLPDCDTLEKLIDNSIRTLKKERLLKIRDKVVIVTGRPHVNREHMSLVKIEEVT